MDKHYSLLQKINKLRTKSYKNICLWSYYQMLDYYEKHAKD
jgi:hypothetical protein